MRRFLFGLFLLSAPLFAEDQICFEEESFPCFELLYKASLGPEFYYIKRTREGGAVQDGWLYGVRGSFERIGRYKWYIGAEGLYGSGVIKGYSGRGSKLRSHLTDKYIEGRLGYTFQAKGCYMPAFTPYIGYGYMWEENNYKNPSPLLVKFTNESPYLAFGFLSTIVFNSKFSAGFNIKARSLNNAVCHVKHDPIFGTLKMHIHDKVQYRFELPFYYDHWTGCRIYEIGLIPFYEWRRYGGRQNYPFDFLDTKLKLYGANLQLTLKF